MFAMFRKKRLANHSPWAFVVVLVLFMILSFPRPAIGLSGIGAILILGAILVEANRAVIWESYLKSYKPGKDKLQRMWSEPRQSYYRKNCRASARRK